MIIADLVYNGLRTILENGFKEQKKYIKDAFIIEELRGGKVLDLGCGMGTYAELFDPHNYVGLEISKSYIRYAKQHKRGDFVLGDGRHLPFKSAAFGAVCSVAVFHHIPDEELFGILGEVKRVMFPSGVFLFMDQVDIKLNLFVDWLFRLIRRFDKGKFIRTPKENLAILAREPGLDIIDSWIFRNGMITYQGVILKRK